MGLRHVTQSFYDQHSPQVGGPYTYIVRHEKERINRVLIKGDDGATITIAVDVNGVSLLAAADAGLQFPGIAVYNAEDFEIDANVKFGDEITLTVVNAGTNIFAQVRSRIVQDQFDQT